MITKGEGAIKLQELYPTAKLGFVDIGAMKKKKKPTVTPRFGEVFEDYVNKFKEGIQPTAEGKIYKEGRFYSDLGPTYNTILKDSTKRNKYDTPKFYKVYDQLDDKNKIVVENFLETKLNLSDSRQANKQITELLEQAKKAKTKGEKDKVLEKINALGEVLESKNLITKVDGQTFGAKNVDSKSSFERIKKNLEKEYRKKDVGIVDYAGGGLATMAHMTRPLDGTR